MPHLAPPPLVAQAPNSPSLQRLRQLEQIEQAARDAEAKNWRTFPTPIKGEPSPGAWLLELNGLIDTSSISCSYYWPGWKLDPDTGIRHTKMRCKRNLNPLVAVNCSTLKVATGGYDLVRRPASALRWGFWRLPEDDGQRQLVAALCDNI